MLTVDGKAEGTILQVFDKPADADVSAVLPALRAKGYIPDDDDCVFEPAAIRPAPRTIAFYEIKPTGARKEAFDATPEDEVPEPPCGEYGWGTHGVRYFLTDTRFSGARDLRQHRPGRHDVRRHHDHAGIGAGPTCTA